MIRTTSKAILGPDHDAGATDAGPRLPIEKNFQVPENRIFVEEKHTSS